MYSTLRSFKLSIDTGLYVMEFAYLNAKLVIWILPVLHLYLFRNEVFSVSWSVSHLTFINNKVASRSILCPIVVTAFGY